MIHIKCGACGRDLSKTDDFSQIKVEHEAADYIYDAVQEGKTLHGVHHFCNRKCMDIWLRRNVELGMPEYITPKGL